MNDGTGDEAPAPPEVMVRVQTISDPEAFKRHLLRMFEQGQPRYPDDYEIDAEPWDLLPEMVEGYVEGWQPIGVEGSGPTRSVMAVALTLSMPAGTDPSINEAAVLALARSRFVGRERVWVSGEHEGPFVKLLVEYRDEKNRPLPSGPADLFRYREDYARELCVRGVAAQATSRGDRGLDAGEGRNAYKKRRRSDGD